MPEATLLLCYDGSEFAKRAIADAPALLAPRKATVLVVWQSSAMLTLAWAGGGAFGGEDIVAMDEAGEAAARRLADEGVRLATNAGFDAEGEIAQAAGPVWDTIVAVADQQDASAIVVGSRGLTGLKHVLLGSVSEGVVRHAHRTTIIVQEPAETTDGAAETAERA
jgi:nucleotide-binding universal stress UspA family protein